MDKDSDPFASNPFGFDNDRTRNMRDTAQQIWLAGLGAFAKAQAEGARVFESLVKEGTEFQRTQEQKAETRGSAPGADAAADMAGRMRQMAEDMGARANQQWDKLGAMFEDRVARALEHLQVPTHAELQALQARVAALEAELAQRAGDAGPTGDLQPD